MAEGPGTGGGGQLGLNSFYGGDTEAAWIATYVLFLLWLIGLLIVPIASRTAAGGAGGASTWVIPLRFHVFFNGGVGGTSSVFRTRREDGFLLLLGSTLANQSGFGVNNAVSTLSWIMMGLAIVWLIVILFGAGYWWMEMMILLPLIVISAINFG
ncbi:hypothetical protein BC829DRAFT_447539 [Chytridium lagenaria]|nr:hypothetical protein BC829DRAFT_447539 [Chytridium lagenaria]